MPKLKTHSGAKKRFRRAASGRIKSRRAFRSHILTKMKSKVKRHMRAQLEVCHADEKSVNRLLNGS